jgi:hypothetical protein
MIGMPLQLCQLKSLLLMGLVLVSCTSTKKTTELISLQEGRWFKTRPEHSLVGSDGRPVTHLFFDMNPEFGKDGRSVNVILSTLADSEHAYKIDLVSGQRHYDHSYCPQDDIWKEQKGEFARPPYSIGYIPRYLDQLGGPQKVLVFGAPSKFSEVINFRSLRVRIVGAFVERECAEGNCIGKGAWTSRLVFLAVDPRDTSFGHIEDVAGLQKVIEWKDVKGHAENLDGRNLSNGVSYPAIRAGVPLSFEEAFEFFKTHSIFMSDGELGKIRNGCTALYEGLWAEVGFERPEDKAVTNMNELKAKLKIRDEIKAKGGPVGFAQRFQVFTKKYFDEITTCGKFVYAGNLNDHTEKFWFLGQVDLFYRLHKEGFYFDCRNNSWQKNSFDARGEPIYDLKKEIDSCKERNLDGAMTYMPNFLEGLKGSNLEYFRFVDYDNHTFGTHNKLYTWVRTPIKKYDCATDTNDSIRKASKVFPEDVRWRLREVRGLEKEMKIIY